MKLFPSAEHFKGCYPEWLSDVCQMIIAAPNGTTFGIYGRWGAGKSSACKAMISEVYKLGNQNNKHVEPLIFDAFLLKETIDPINTALAQLTEQLRLLNQTKPTSQTSKLRQIVSQIFAPFAGAAAKAVAIQQGLPSDMADVVQQGTTATVSTTIDYINLESKPKTDAPIDKLLILIDDLDRCSPVEAIRFLSNFSESVSKIKAEFEVVSIIACDPDVLARHAAHVFGITLTEGLEAIAKYIHAPFLLPIGTTKGHRSAFEHYINQYKILKPEANQRLIEAAINAVGIVPIREIISALPQAILWINRAWPGFNGPELAYLPGAYLFFSILSINLPSVVRFSTKDHDSGLHTLFKSASDSNASLVSHKAFGTHMVDAIKLRPDLIRLGDVLIGNQTSEFVTKTLGIVSKFGL